MSEIWTDKKRSIFGLPLSFTRYTLTNDKLLIKTGLLSTTEEEIRLYRITDLTFKQSFGEKIFGVGTIHCCSADKSTPEIDIMHVKDARNVKEMISDVVENVRTEKRVGLNEFMTEDADDHDMHDVPHHTH
jgi:uncharacterized membrane protein YdbT with pleckstrin-like domain